MTASDRAMYTEETTRIRKLEAEVERLREIVAAPDWGEQYLREMDDRKQQGDRAHRWKTRAEAAEADICSLTRLVRDIQKYALTPEPVLRSIEQTLLAIAERARESRGATDEGLLTGESR